MYNSQGLSIPLLHYEPQATSSCRALYVEPNWESNSVTLCGRGTEVYQISPLSRVRDRMELGLQECK